MRTRLRIRTPRLAPPYPSAKSLHRWLRCLSHVSVSHPAFHISLCMHARKQIWAGQGLAYVAYAEAQKGMDEWTTDTVAEGEGDADRGRRSPDPDAERAEWD